jgi:hypothetical protein
LIAVDEYLRAAKEYLLTRLDANSPDDELAYRIRVATELEGRLRRASLAGLVDLYESCRRRFPRAAQHWRLMGAIDLQECAGLARLGVRLAEVLDQAEYREVA